jgi:hypothetical protein
MTKEQFLALKQEKKTRYVAGGIPTLFSSSLIYVAVNLNITHVYINY